MNSSPVVFLPGTLCDERLFHHQAPLFASPESIDLRHSENVDHMIDLVRAVPLEKFTLIGFSMGGHLALEFALMFPDRVENLIVIASSAEGYPEKEKALVLANMNVIERGPFRGITDRRLHEYLHPSNYDKPGVRKLIHEMAGADAKEVYLRQIKATLERRNLLGEVPQLKMPVVFIGGAEDQIVSIDSVKRSADRVPQAQFHSVSECGHFVPLEKPEVLNEILKGALS